MNNNKLLVNFALIPRLSGEFAKHKILIILRYYYNRGSNQFDHLTRKKEVIKVFT